MVAPVTSAASYLSTFHLNIYFTVKAFDKLPISSLLLYFSFFVFVFVSNDIVPYSCTVHERWRYATVSQTYCECVGIVHTVCAHVIHWHSRSDLDKSHHHPMLHSWPTALFLLPMLIHHSLSPFLVSIFTIVTLIGRFSYSFNFIYLSIIFLRSSSHSFSSNLSSCLHTDDQLFP